MAKTPTITKTDRPFAFRDFTFTWSGEELLLLWRGLSMLNAASARDIAESGISTESRDHYVYTQYFLDGLNEVMHQELSKEEE